MTPQEMDNIHREWFNASRTDTTPTRTKLRILFRQYWNDYLTVQCFADAHGWDTDYATRVIDAGRTLHNRRAVKLNMAVPANWL